MSEQNPKGDTRQSGGAAGATGGGAATSAPPNVVPAVTYDNRQKRLEQFMMAILAAEVQRKGLGLSQGGVGDIKKLAKLALATLDNEDL